MKEFNLYVGKSPGSEFRDQRSEKGWWRLEVKDFRIKDGISWKLIWVSSLGKRMQ